MNISSVTSGSVASVPGGSTRGTATIAPTASVGTTGVSVATKTPSTEQVAQAVKQMNDTFAQRGQNLYSSVEKDKISGIDVVQVLDNTTHEVVAQYPSKAIVAMADAVAQPKGGSGQLLNVSA